MTGQLVLFKLARLSFSRVTEKEDLHAVTN